LSAPSILSKTEAVLAGLRHGQPEQITEALEGYASEERTPLRRFVRPQANAMLAAQSGARDPEGRWVGALGNGHWYAAQVALLGTASRSHALRQRTMDGPVARDLLPRLFPDDLPLFVTAFSERFLTDPKAWDGNRGIEAMFDWAQRGLIAPPVHQGAVLALICWAPRPSLWGYLHSHPVLIRTTLPALFDVPGVRGASAAQRDEGGLGGRLDRYVIPRLIREGAWTRAETLEWCTRALNVPRSEYEYRWFRGLHDRIAVERRRPN
jgi:hypothetical protein